MSQIRVNHLTFAYEGGCDNIFENVSFSIDTDWKLGFIGRNGKGKSTFLNLLMGKYEYTGSITSNAVFDYFPYDISGERGNCRRQNLWKNSRQILNCGEFMRSFRSCRQMQKSCIGHGKH